MKLAVGIEGKRFQVKVGGILKYVLDGEWMLGILKVSQGCEMMNKIGNMKNITAVRSMYLISLFLSLIMKY